MINADLRDPQPSGRAGVALGCHQVNPMQRSGLKGSRAESRDDLGDDARQAGRSAQEVESDPDLPESRTAVQIAIYVKKKKQTRVHRHIRVRKGTGWNGSGLVTAAASREGNGRQGTNTSLCILLTHLTVGPPAYITSLNTFRHTRGL